MRALTKLEPESLGERGRLKRSGVLRLDEAQSSSPHSEVP
ncbi:hypothetical protein NSU_1084 [Novosphingobium pentaromativorans US6-1]|uniref:Uncharacterized protein n=1 Tax=Novosphingobium pentaromativorans US6-1 TaxID=1088721 RepID=G6E9R3_9SPHN|nr:hypothetical protein NSU_1084 [Novosphingobium pentaromativorans US6-1]